MSQFAPPPTEPEGLLLHIHNDLFYRTFLTIVTSARPKYELPDNGHRPKHIAAFYYEF